MRKFVIIDGNAIIHRCYHAVPKYMKSPAGVPTNAVFGFSSILLGILESEKPDYLTVAFDMKGPTFRHAEMVEYKATRAKTDDDLIVQFPVIRALLGTWKIPKFEREGLEADDFIGIISKELQVKHPDIDILIVTGDQDALQLVNEKTTMVSPISGYTKVKRYGPNEVFEKLGVWPNQVADYKGLRGDASDNIKGVPGIGEKGAQKLLAEFGSVEGIYERIEEVQPEKLRELLRANKDVAILSKRIATILRTDGEIDFKIDDCGVPCFDFDAVRKVFQELAFNSLLGRLDRMQAKNKRVAPVEGQGSLF